MSNRSLPDGSPGSDVDAIGSAKGLIVHIFPGRNAARSKQVGAFA